MLNGYFYREGEQVFEMYNEQVFKGESEQVLILHAEAIFKGEGKQPFEFHRALVLCSWNMIRGSVKLPSA